MRGAVELWLSGMGETHSDHEDLGLIGLTDASFAL
jgi:hypothetical protein